MLRIFCCGLAVALSSSFLCAPTYAEEQQTPALKVVTAKDFWDTTGHENEHTLNEAMHTELQNIATNGQAKPELRLRAGKLLCDLAGHNRHAPEFAAEHAAQAMTVGMKYLESNFGDETVRKFSPELGFTHLSISRKSDDPAGMWFLIESVEPARNGGLNLRIDPATWKVTKVEHWGKVTPATP